jgi:hypothetical protein
LSFGFRLTIQLPAQHRGMGKRMNDRLTFEEAQANRNGVAKGPAARTSRHNNACQSNRPVDPDSDESPTMPLSQRAFDDLVAGHRERTPTGAGPGSELKRMLPWLARACKSEPLKRRIATINQWGVKGCQLNSETIAGWLVREAARHGMDEDDLPLATARALVRTAIRRYERKFPDGPLETD